jgi:gas vesicle protein
MGKTARGFALGAVVAGVAGYVAGILTAPKSGKETRDDIKVGVKKGMAEAEKRLKKLNNELGHLVEQAQKKGAKLTGSAKAEFNQLLASAKEAKEKLRVMLSAIHEGDAEDKDLDKAIKEANAAIEHLSEYLKK